ncbi:MAG: MarR family transcriptional regulator [Thermoanaerobaculia bacterium]|nr:MarR family transcriptional regulator [Thermoanaerobaculia bacterium]
MTRAKPPGASAATKPTLGVHLWLLLWKAAKAQEVHARRSAEGTGLCLSDFGVLEALLHKGPLPVNTLGKKILITSGSVTAAVDRLERAHLVERMDTATDRRARIVHLTPKGTTLIRGLFAEHAKDMERAFSHLDGPEREALARLLRKVGRNADEAGSTKPVTTTRPRGKRRAPTAG